MKSSWKQWPRLDSGSDVADHRRTVPSSTCIPSVKLSAIGSRIFSVACRRCCLESTARRRRFSIVSRIIPEPTKNFSRIQRSFCYHVSDSCCSLDYHSKKVTNWSIDWLIDWLVGWLVGWLVDWLTDWLTAFPGLDSGSTSQPHIVLSKLTSSVSSIRTTLRESFFGISTTFARRIRTLQQTDNNDGNKHNYTTTTKCTSIQLIQTDTWFPALRFRIRFRIRFHGRFRKNCVRTCRSINTVAVCRSRGV